MANEMAIVGDEVEVKKNFQTWPVDLIVVHIRPHFEEIVAIHFLKRYGEKFFPGIGDASVEAWTEGKIIKDYVGESADQLLHERRILCVGTCGGMFDEHGKTEPTSAHLVARYLGVLERPELQEILRFCKRVDNDGKSMTFDPHSIMNDMYEDGGDDDDGLQSVFDWAMRAVKVKIYGQKRFHDCPEEFKKTGRIINGGPVKIALVESDNYKMQKWVRFAYSTEVVVQKKSSGNIMIFSSPNVVRALDMRDLSKIIRLMELKKRGLPIPAWPILEAANAISQCLWWFFNKGMQILNGTLTAPDIEPTVLSLNDLAKAIALACAPTVDPCTAVKCYKSCKKYDLGLIACRKKRFEYCKEG
ncbi:MAG: hypothetical protein Q8O93_00145 [bacterium]|nr:hypothetical protein [bacterium]